VKWSLSTAVFVNNTLRLNEDAPNVASSAFFPTQVWLDQWTITVLFSVIKGNTSDGGFTLILQSDKIDTTGPSHAGLGYGITPDSNNGFMNSIALEFDMVSDSKVDDTLPDCQPPHLSLHSMAAKMNSAIEMDARKGCWNSLVDPYTSQHNVTLVYSQKLLVVYYDQIVNSIMNVAIDIPGTLELNNSLAWVGFTSSTGTDHGDVHIINSFWYTYQSVLNSSLSTVSGLGNNTAGSLQTVTVQSVDEFGHPYPFGSQSVLSAAMAVANASQFTYTWKFVSDGVFQLIWNSTLATDDHMTISIDGVPIKDAPFAVTVTAIDVDPAQCTYTGSVTYGLAGQNTTFQIHTFDKYGNPTASNVTFAGSTLVGVNGTADNITISNLADPVSKAIGVWELSFLPTKVGTYEWHIVANGGVPTIQPPLLHVAHGPPDANNCKVNGIVAQFVVNTTQQFSITLFDSENNLYTGNATLTVVVASSDGQTQPPVNVTTDDEGVYQCKYVVTRATNWTITIKVVDKAIPASNGIPASVQSSPGPVNAAASQIVSPSGTVVAGTPIFSSLVASDAFGNPILGAVAWAVTINNVGYVPSSQGGGMWVVNWTPTIANTYTMNALIGGVPVARSGLYVVKVTPVSKPDMGKTVVSGEGVLKAKQGRTSMFWVK
jgi:hypothetical protein